jgi:hypothetical protein
LDDLNKERVRFNIEIIKLLTLLLITTGGGALALLVEGVDSLLKNSFAAAGMTVAIISGSMAIYVYKSTLKKLK